MIGLCAAIALAGALNAAEPIRISCVGDSITAGHGIKQDYFKYPQQLGFILGEDFNVRNFGVSGTTLLSKGDHPYIKTGAYKGALDFKPNVVIIKLGTNDTKSWNWKHSADFEKDLNAMIDAFAALETKPIIYLGLPCTFFGANGKGIDETRISSGVIPVVEKIAKERNLKIIDFHAATASHPEVFPDKLHPNAGGAKIMAQAAAKKLKEDGVAK